MENNKMAGLPRKYISWSQINSLEWSETQYIRSYIYGERKTSPQLELGSRFAKAMEFREKPEDKWIKDVVNQIPDFPEREFRMEAVINDIPIMGIADGFKPKNNTIRDDKTGAKPNFKSWTGQQSMYSLIRYLNTKKLPKNVIYWAETKFTTDGKLVFTGKVQKFKLDITMKDILSMIKRITSAHARIKTLCENERQMFGKLPFDKN